MSRRDAPKLFAGELRAILALLALALLILAALAVSHLGAFLMKRLVTFTAVAMAAVALSACAGLTGSTTAGEAVLKDLQGCTRHYEGAIGAGVNGSFKIDCQPAGATAPPT